MVSRRASDIGLADVAVLRWARFAGTEQAAAGPPLRGVPLHPFRVDRLAEVALPGVRGDGRSRRYAATMAIDADDTIVAIPPMSHA